MTQPHVVFHLPGAFTRTTDADPVTGEPFCEQRCTRCGALIERSTSMFPRYRAGSEVERLEYRDDAGQVHVKYTSLPLYDIDRSYSQKGRAVPRCHT